MQPPRESQTEYILREAKALFKNPAIMWAGGKDSTTLLFITKRLFGSVPFPVIFLDTGYKFRETYQFIEKLEKAWGLTLIRARNMEAVRQATAPDTVGRFQCCTLLKTDALKQTILKHKFDAVLVSIRWDEQGVRGKEAHFSWREDPPHMRIHPLLDWSIDDIWAYIQEHNIPHNPLYDLEVQGKKYRSIGCYPCTQPVEKERKEERAGRAQDKEEIMEQLRSLGYM